MLPFIRAFATKMYKKILKLLIIMIFMIFVITVMTVRAESSNKPDCPEENALDYKKPEKFIFFDEKIKASQAEERILQQGSIINVPTHCPPNMLKVGNRCRSVY